MGVPHALGETQQAELKAAVQDLPEQVGIELANWNWRVVHRFVSEQFGISLSRSSCLNYLHRLGFSFKRPRKRLVKADETRREAFVAEYAALRDEAQRTGARTFFADAAHFRADAELRSKWVLSGKPALVESTSPRYGDKASYYSAVCLETGGGGVDGTGGEQQLWDIGSLSGITEGEAPWAIERDLGQRASAPRRGAEGVPADAGTGAAAGESARVQPGLQRG